MNVTFLIGNGFDINLGLKTKYTDFYDLYIKSNKERDENDSIKKFCNIIENDERYETWADFEAAFAKNAFGSKNDVRDVLADFTIKFADYLKTQIQLCDYKPKDKIAEQLSHFLLKGYSYLENRDRKTIEGSYKKHATEIITLNFVNFNYTDTLERLVTLFKRSHITNYIYNTKPIINIHGKLNENIIIGIDSISQFKDYRLKDNKSVEKYCVKREINELVGAANIENNYVETIEGSTIIYIYGISFGKSDQSRWNVITEWIKKDVSHKLVIYKYGVDYKKYDVAYSLKRLDRIDEYKDEYLEILGFEKDEFEQYHDQIFVIDSTDVLQFKLINDEPSKADSSEETKEAVTV